MRRWIVALLMVSLIATSCASGTSDGTETAVASGETDNTADTDSDSAAAPAAADEPSDASDDDEPAAASSEDSDEPAMAASSPIGAFFADDGGFQTALDEYRLRVEEGILVCMAEQGFEFAVAGGGNNAVQDAQNELSERDWTIEYGYGISTSFDSVAQSQATNPNAEILFSLGPAEREAWTETLIGVGNDLGDLGNGAIPLEERGCIGSSIIDTGGQGPIDGLDAFGEAYAEREEAIFDTNEMIIAVGEWTRCMGEAGYPDYSEIDAPEASFSERLSVITAPIGPALEALEPGEGQSLFDGAEIDLAKLPGLDIDALRALQDEELATALVDLDCYDAHVRGVYEPLRNEFEVELMDEFGAELDALRSIGQ